MQREELEKLKEELRVLLAERLNVRARSFGAAVRKAGRMLPAPARAAAAELQQLDARVSHPKLAARTDPQQARRAAGTVREALMRYRPGVIAARDRSYLMADIGVKLIILICLALAFAYWQGVG